MEGITLWVCGQVCPCKSKKCSCNGSFHLESHLYSKYTWKSSGIFENVDWSSKCMKRSIMYMKHACNVSLRTLYPPRFLIHLYWDGQDWIWLPIIHAMLNWFNLDQCIIFLSDDVGLLLTCVWLHCWSIIHISPLLV